MTELLLNREALLLMAGERELQDYFFLGPVRSWLSTRRRNGCRKCPNQMATGLPPERAWVTSLINLQHDPKQVQRLKAQLGTQVLVLPMPSGIIRL